MKLLLIALVAVGNLFAAAPMSKQNAYEVNRMNKIFEKSHLGTQVFNATQLGAKGTWNYSVSGGAIGTDIRLLDAEGLPLKFPVGAVITNCLIDVATAPTSTTSTATLAFRVKAAGDLKAATIVTSYTATQIACVPAGAVANMIKIALASEGYLAMRVASEALTAGKINVWVQYVLSE